MLEGIERGFICDDPTGRAGEDSIYVGVSGIGPWCESCHADMVQEVEGDTRAEERALWAAKVAEIRAAVGEWARCSTGLWCPMPHEVALLELARELGLLA